MIMLFQSRIRITNLVIVCWLAPLFVANTGSVWNVCAAAAVTATNTTTSNVTNTTEPSSSPSSPGTSAFSGSDEIPAEDGNVAPEIEMDPDYPGMSPNATSFAFTVNVKFHDSPEDIHIVLQKKDETYFNTEYLDMFEYHGIPGQDDNQLWYRTFDDLSAGIYFLKVASSSSAGLQPNGWITITNHTHVVWQHDGDFRSSQSAAVGVTIMVVGYHGYTIVWAQGLTPP